MRPEGEARGRAEGEARGKPQVEPLCRLYTARNMHNAGVQLEDIMRFTGLTREQAMSLQ